MDKYGETKQKKHWFKIKAVYPCSTLNLIVWGDNLDDATNRAKYWQKGALAYCFVAEVPAPYDLKWTRARRARA